MDTRVNPADGLDRDKTNGVGGSLGTITGPMALVALPERIASCGSVIVYVGPLDTIDQPVCTQHRSLGPSDPRPTRYMTHLSLAYIEDILDMPESVVFGARKRCKPCS